ncbi:MAG: protein kinase domain-containing protein [Gemmatimonadaceae bacterium]
MPDHITTPPVTPSGYTRPAMRGATPPAPPTRDARQRRARRGWGRSLAVRIFLGTAAVIAAALGGALLATSRSAARAADEAVAAGLAATRDQVETTLAGRARALRDAARIFALNSPFGSLVEVKDRQSVYDQTHEAAERTGADWVQIVDEQGIRLAKGDEPSAPADTLGGALIGGALEGRPTVGFGVAGDTALFQAVAVPIGAGRIVGALMAVKALDAPFADSVKRATGSDVVFVVAAADARFHVAASTLPRTPASIGQVFRSTSGTVPGGAATPGAEVTIAGTHYLARSAVLRSAGGTPVGGFVALRDRDEALAPFDALRRTVLLAGAAGLLAAFLLSYLIARQVTRPVAALVAATRQAAQGDYGADITVRGRDEIGTLADAFRAMLADLRDKEALVGVLTANDADRTAVPADRLPTGERAAAIAPGQTLGGRYEIKEVLGAGGMGVVYRALDRELHEVLAIKTLRPELVDRDPTALERFKSEIRLARRIAHRNVVRTYDLGEAGGTYYISMEYVEGKSLKELVRARGRLPVPAVLTIGKQLARALESAHEQGVVHRDIKPQNMIVEPGGVLKVMDFGIARLAEAGSGRGLTQTGTLVGTPEYMAPEQLLGEEVDARADIYAAGCVIYECLVGRVPLSADSPITLIAKVLEEVPESPRALSPDVPAPLDAIVMRCLAKDRAARPASAGELHDLLEEVEGTR